MKVLFIFPSNEPFEVIVSAGDSPWKSKLNAHRNIKKIDCVYPTGLLSIAAYLKQEMPEAEIRILDCNVIMNRLADSCPEGLGRFSREDFFQLCIDAVKDFEPDLIGISTLFCSNYRDLLPFAGFLCTRYPEVPVIAGGHLAAAVYERIFAESRDIDAISFGEGEIPTLELCRAMQENRLENYLAESPCWITAEKLRCNPGFKPERKLITNLDEIPPYDFGMLVFPDVYFNSSRYFFVIETSADCPEMFIFSTRGCPYRCVFCASQNVHGHRVRSYSTERIKQDILYYNRTFNIKRFVFYDDHFLVDRKRAIEILNFVAENNLQAEIPTPAFFSIDDEVARAMRGAGIREVNITIESGNEETLRNIMHKPANLKRAEEAVAALHRAGIMAISNILIGLPGETPESIEKGLEYLQTTEINWFQCFVTAPLPGSELYDDCLKNDYLVGNDPFVMDFKKCIIRTPDFEPEYIERKAYQMNLLLNFVNNYDYRSGNYETALRLFERVLFSVIDTHAFAYYFAAKCCLKLKLTEKFAAYKKKYREMVDLYPFWQEWADEFKLEPLP